MPAASVAWMSIWPLRACSGLPSTSMLTRSSLIRSVSGVFLRSGRGPRLGADDAAPAVGDHVLELVAEALHEALHRPRRCVAERADGVALDLVGDADQQVQV